MNRSKYSVRDRVLVADVQAIPTTSRTAAARPARNALLPGEMHEVPHDQKIAGEPFEQMTFSSLSMRSRTASVISPYAARAFVHQFPQVRVGRLAAAGL